MVNQARLGHPEACGAKLRREAGLVSWEHVKMSNISFDNQSFWCIFTWPSGGSDDGDDDDDDDYDDDDAAAAGGGGGGGEECPFGWFCDQCICRNLF